MKKSLAISTEPVKTTITLLKVSLNEYVYLRRN